MVDGGTTESRKRNGKSVEELAEKITDACLLKSPFMVLESVFGSQSSLVLLSARRSLCP